MKQRGIWPATDPLTCVYDAKTKSRMPQAISLIENEIRSQTGGGFVLSVAGVGEGELKSDTKITPTADSRSIDVTPDSIWGLVKPKLTSKTRLYECVGPSTAAATTPPSPVVSQVGYVPDMNAENGAFAPTPPSPGPAAIRLYVPRLASGLVALDAWSGDFQAARWNNDIAQAFIQVAYDFLGFAPAVTGSSGDDVVYAHMRLAGGAPARTHAEAEAVFAQFQAAINAARSEAGIVPPRDPYSSSSSASTAVADDNEADKAPSTMEAGMGGGMNTALALAAGAGVLWMFWKVSGPSKRKR